MDYETIINTAISLANVDLLKALWYGLDNHIHMEEKAYFKSKILTNLPTVLQRHALDIAKEQEDYFQRLTALYEKKRIVDLLSSDETTLISYLRDGGPTLAQKIISTIVKETQKGRDVCDLFGSYKNFGRIVYWTAREYPRLQSLCDLTSYIGVITHDHSQDFEEVLFEEAALQQDYEALVYVLASLNQEDQRVVHWMRKLSTVLGEASQAVFVSIFLNLLRRPGFSHSLKNLLLCFESPLLVQILISLGMSKSLTPSCRKELARMLSWNLENKPYNKNEVLRALKGPIFNLNAKKTLENLQTENNTSEVDHESREQFHKELLAFLPGGGRQGWPVVIAIVEELIAEFRYDKSELWIRTR